MSIPSTNCPDCNSIQRFARKEREVDGRIEVFVRCSACGYEQIIESFRAEDRLARKRARLRRNRRVRSLRT